MRLVRKYWSLFEALRPVQWTKNLSLFAAAILNGQLSNPEIFLKSVFAFIVFCLLSSSSYLINDLLDINNDRKHPVKKNRPLARGDLDISTAVFTSIFLLLFGLGLSFAVNSGFFLICVFFIFLQYIYSLFLKKKAVLDIIGIAFFFILRA